MGRGHALEIVSDGVPIRRQVDIRPGAGGTANGKLAGRSALHSRWIMSTPTSLEPLEMSPLGHDTHEALVAVVTFCGSGVVRETLHRRIVVVH